MGAGQLGDGLTPTPDRPHLPVTNKDTEAHRAVGLPAWGDLTPLPAPSWLRLTALGVSAWEAGYRVTLAASTVGKHMHPV